jgi:hypothetical protein
VAQYVEALTREVRARGFLVLPASELEKHQRAATMCGEDAECLATVGQRAEAAMVLGVGLGAAGKQFILSALLVGAGQPRAFSVKRAATALDFAAVAKAAVDDVFAGVRPHPIELTPKVVDLPPPPPPGLVEPITVVPPPSSRLRTPAIVTGVGAGVLALAGGTLTVVAQQHFEGLRTTPVDRRAAADSTQRTLNVAADVTVGTAIAAGVTSVILFLLDRP